MTVTTTGRLPRDAHETGYDVAIIGAGVVGCAIARELARHPLRVALVEAADDVGKGTSKANTAILHTGFDATPGTLEARLVRDGYRLLSGYAAEAGIPVRRVGALLVAWDAEQLAALPQLAAKAERNGYHATRLLDAAELRRREPHLGPGALGALEVPDESVICPWTTVIGYATQAVRAGVDLHLGCRVHGVGGQRGRGSGGGAWHEILTDRGTLRARHLVNAAGLRSDEIDRLLGHDAFTVTPRRGQLMVFDKSARRLVRHIVLPVPTALGKGVLVAPTVFGNVLLGPTAEDLADKSATQSTEAGLAFLRAHGARVLPELLAEEVTAVYAGLRAATEHDDYQIHAHPEQRYVAVGGIRSTGLTGSLAIAAHVVGLLAAGGLTLGAPRELPPVRMPALGDASPRPFERPELIAADPEYGTVICPCERVTRGEVRDALASTVPPAGLDGLRRRTRVAAGRCQGTRCAAAVRALCEARTPAAATDDDTAATRPAPATAPDGADAVGPVERSVDVLVVGAGAAGLAAAGALAAAGVGRVEVLEQQPSAGGVLRYAPWACGAWPDPRAPRRAPAGREAARRLLDAATGAGALVRTGWTVTGWAGPLTLAATGPGGRELITARAVVLATGARERPRAARGVPGARGEGVFTGEGALRALDEPGQLLGATAVVVGSADDAGYRVAGALRQAGTRPVALVGAPSLGPSPWRALTRLGWGVPVLGDAAVTELTGAGGRVTGVRLRRADGAMAQLDCAAVVFCGSWVPENELAAAAGLAVAADLGRPAVDAEGRTSHPGVFAVGGLPHPAGPGRRTGPRHAAARARALATAVAQHLAGAPWPPSAAPHPTPDARDEAATGGAARRTTVD